MKNYSSLQSFCVRLHRHLAPRFFPERKICLTAFSVLTARISFFLLYKAGYFLGRYTYFRMVSLEPFCLIQLRKLCPQANFWAYKDLCNNQSLHKYPVMHLLDHSHATMTAKSSGNLFLISPNVSLVHLKYSICILHIALESSVIASASDTEKTSVWIHCHHFNSFVFQRRKLRAFCSRNIGSQVCCFPWTSWCTYMFLLKVNKRNSSRKNAVVFPLEHSVVLSRISNIIHYEACITPECEENHVAAVLRL